MNILPVVLQIVMVLLIAAIGVGLRARKVLGDAAIRAINSIILNISWPALVLMITQRDMQHVTSGQFFATFLFSLALMAVFSVGFFYVGRAWLPKQRQSVFAVLCAMPNAAFVGLPLVDAAYGAQGVTYLGAFVIAFNLVMWTVHVRLFGAGGQSWLKSFLNVGVIANLTGLVLFMLRIRLGDPLRSLSVQLGGMTTPLSMLLLGVRLGDTVHLRDMLYAPLWITAAIRLLAMPLALYVLLNLLGVGGMQRNVLVLASAMPCANAAQLFAERYGKDHLYAAHAVAVTLVLCLATIPFILLLTGR